MIPAMIAALPVGTLVASAVKATDAQRADVARRVMAAFPSNADRARVVAAARAFLADLESAW